MQHLRETGAVIARAQAAGERAIEKLRPRLIWFYSLRRRLATIAVIMLTAWLFAHIMLGANGMLIYRLKRSEIQSLQAEINSLKKENQRFDRRIQDLKTDPRTIEKAAREQLHYARPGEVVYVSPAPLLQDAPRIDAARK